MKLNVFGLGYVGCVSAACLAKQGHDVTGVDVNPKKVEILNRGKSPIVEVGLAEIIEDMVRAQRLRATTDISEGFKSSEASLVCVGTPSNTNGSLDLTFVERVCAQIGAALATIEKRHVVVIRSTVLPGTAERVVIPMLEKYSRKKAGRDFGLCVNPEFLREGSSLTDFYRPPFTLIGAADSESARPVRELYSGIAAPVFETSLKTAEMVKYVCNSFHALKVTFANEVGNICKGLGIDSHEVMDVFCQDSKLNISRAYLKPGFAFGGSCLPKDLRAINYKAKQLDIDVPVLSAILESNRRQIERTIEMVLATGKKRIGLLGLSFKSGTDDLRESPMVTLVESLLGKGLQLAIYDGDISLALLLGTNKEYIEREIPHISQLMRDSVDEVLDHSEVIVVGKKAEEFRLKLKPKDTQIVIDLVRIFEQSFGDGYQGLSW